MVKRNNWKRFFGKRRYDNLPVDRIESVALHHYRKMDGEKLLAKGGRTICCIKVDNVEFTGVARCMDIDNYEKKEGRTRAMKEACLKYWMYSRGLKRRV
jgi:hypothetical protein